MLPLGQGTTGGSLRGTTGGPHTSAVLTGGVGRQAVFGLACFLTSLQRTTDLELERTRGIRLFN